MSHTPQSGLSRRELLTSPARSPLRRPWPESPSRTSTPRRATPFRSPWSAAAAAAPAPPTTPCPPRTARSSWSPWPTSSRTGSSQLQEPAQETFGRAGRRARGPQVHRLRRATRRRWTASSRATSSSSPRRRPSAGSTSPTPSRRASTSSWRSRSRWTGRARARCSSWPRKPRRRTSRSASA